MSNNEKMIAELAADRSNTQRILGEQGAAIASLAKSQESLAGSVRDLAKSMKDDNAEMRTFIDHKTSTDIYKLEQLEQVGLMLPSKKGGPTHSISAFIAERRARK